MKYALKLKGEVIYEGSKFDCFNHLDKITGDVNSALTVGGYAIEKKEPDITKITIEFPNGDKESFDTIGAIGSFILSETDKGAYCGAFATGHFDRNLLTAVASGVIDAIVKKMTEDGFSANEIVDTLAKIIANSIPSAFIRDVMNLENKTLDELLKLIMG